MLRCLMRALVALWLAVLEVAYGLAHRYIVCRGDYRAPSRPAKSVIVIGGGIAGTSCAFSLNRMGVDVKLVECRDILGGNAKTTTWDVANSTGGVETVRTGLSVLGWPTKYFHWYAALLNELRVAVQEVRPKFYVSCDGATPSFRHGETNVEWRDDMKAWDRAVARASRVNLYFSGKAMATSMYAVSALNPLNLVTARLWTRVHGVSDAFWDSVVVPVYSSSFLTARLDQMPAMILPLLDDIISVGLATPVRPLQSWVKGSNEVFDKMAKEIGHENIFLKTNVHRVVTNTGTGGVAVQLESGEVLYGDAVVFACPASAVMKMTKGCAGPCVRAIVGRVTYENERDDNFVVGSMHRDISTVPGPFQQELFDRSFSNYVRVWNRDNVENTFVLSTWIPPVQNLVKSGVLPATPQLFVTYNEGGGDRVAGTAKKKERLVGYQGEVDNSWAHPQFTLANQLLAMTMRFCQGEHNMFFCGSYTTPGNGHDLSMLSGVAVARRLAGPAAAFPFPAGSTTKEMVRDLDSLSSIMGL